MSPDLHHWMPTGDTLGTCFRMEARRSIDRCNVSPLWQLATGDVARSRRAVAGDSGHEILARCKRSGLCLCRAPLTFEPSSRGKAALWRSDITLEHGDRETWTGDEMQQEHQTMRRVAPQAKKSSVSRRRAHGPAWQQGTDLLYATGSTEEPSQEELLHEKQRLDK